MTPESGRLWEAFLHNSPGCRWILEPDGRFREIVGDPTPIFGRSTDQLQGKLLAEILDPAHGEVWSGRIVRTLGGEIVTLRELHGNTSWDITLSSIPYEGRLLVGGLGREVSAWSTVEQQLRNTVLSALKSQDFERRMAAKFLHDSVGQNLTALGLQLDLIKMDLETVSPEICGRIGEIQKMLETMMEEVREYSYALNPSTVERAGLRAALDRLAARVKPQFAGTLRINADPSLKIDPKIAPPLYHIAQEAVQNAAQHASCSLIEIAVKSTRSGPVLEVRDNGKGFDAADIARVHRGLGLLSMEHYAAQAGFDLTINSTLGSGTIVRAAWPEKP